MNQKGFINIIVIIGLVILAGIAGYFIANKQMLSTPSPTPTPVVCTQEAKQCPDGSYVSREGKNCEFAKCPGINPSPITKPECKKDSDCPSAQYSCEAIQGEGTACPANDPCEGTACPANDPCEGTACPANDPSCVPTSTIIKGICKLKEGNRCDVNSNCLTGLCHTNVCTSPVGRQCKGPSDTSCPTGYKCVQGCGWPVPRPDEPPPSYFCQLKGYDRPCPICLAENTLIDTPSGVIPVQDLRKGAEIWTINKSGARVSAKVFETVRTPVPSTHQVVYLLLADGRKLFASPGHPIGDGRTIGDLSVGDVLDGSYITIAELLPYKKSFTYDILPSGETGFYWANDILIKSTLFPW